MPSAPFNSKRTQLSTSSGAGLIDSDRGRRARAAASDARLYAPDVVSAINALNLPRYGLANYVAATPHKPPTPAEARQLQDLSRAGKRLMGFCRTNPGGPTVWDLLKSDPDRYIYKAVRHGITWNYRSGHPNQGEPLHASHVGAGLVPAQSEGQPQGLPLPDDIAVGFNPPTLHQSVGEVASVNDIETIRLRKGWNKTAPGDYGLPTETGRSRGDGSVPTEDKQELRRRLNALDDELNRYLATEYGVDPSKKDAPCQVA